MLYLSLIGAYIGVFPRVRKKVLLWCDRHCCLCKKQCGINIEVHHIVPTEKDGTDDIDNAIALCLECHGKMGYNGKHPIGNKFKVEELKSRREQVFEEFTRHLVPAVYYEITQQLPNGFIRKFPNIGFVLSHYGDSLPVRVFTRITVVRKRGKPIPIQGLYSGERCWNLNPRFTVYGHFTLPDSENKSVSGVRLRLVVSIIDQFDRQHNHLPVDYVYSKSNGIWNLTP